MHALCPTRLILIDVFHCNNSTSTNDEGGYYVMECTLLVLILICSLALLKHPLSMFPGLGDSD
jgi:hypothetical protein